jgi:hypothetical protein
MITGNQRGIGLMEVVVATIIAVIAVVALAYSFGVGRGLVSRFGIARVALAAAQGRMERLSTLPATSDSLQIGQYGTFPVWVDGRAVAQESWKVDSYTDKASGHPQGTADLRSVTVTVAWGSGGPNEKVTLTRLFPVQ